MDLWTAAVAATGLLLYGIAAAVGLGLLVLSALVGVLGGAGALCDELIGRQRGSGPRGLGMARARLKNGAR